MNGRLIRSDAPVIELDRHDPQHVFPVGLVLKDFA
jgi:hypothetical protein